MDPEYQRYKREHPSFPGLQTCIELLHRSNVTGAYLDALIADLEAHVRENCDDLIAAVRTETNARVRSLLLAALAEAPTGTAIPLFAEYLTAADENLRVWAARGLYKLDTKEARRLLWEARAHQFSTPEETERFRHLLDTVKHFR